MRRKLDPTFAPCGEYPNATQHSNPELLWDHWHGLYFKTCKECQYHGYYVRFHRKEVDVPFEVASNYFPTMKAVRKWVKETHANGDCNEGCRCSNAFPPAR